jgi:heme o synthase
VWTPPHFWALAIRYRDDYSAAEVPMLPSVMSLEATARRIIAYTVVLWATSLAFGAVAGVGVIYWAAALVLGAVFLAGAVGLYREPTEARAMRLFGWSITYLTLLFAAIAVDQLVRHV